jgi:hypothetical protein
MGGTCSRVGKMSNTYNILVGNPKENILGKYKSRWKDNIKLDLKEMKCDNWVWIYFIQH